MANTAPIASVSIKQQIIELAAEFGFDKVGFAAAEKLTEELKNLRTYLTENRHGSMEWLSNRERERGDIHTYWPPVKSVVVLGMNYFTQAQSVKSSRPRWSNYAWGNDYHRLIKKRLKKMIARIRENHPDVGAIACADTSPIMEKVWAARAGLGWQGKHTNLITRDYGSWLFLGEILLDVPIEPDTPFDDDLCGSCTACISACPTGALDGAYQIDARSCISYLTIEHKGEMSDELASKVSGWIYGCDICQEVCPWNEKFAKPSTEEAFQPRAFTSWDWETWETMTHNIWDVTFRGSAARRPGFDGMKRNIIAAKQVDSNQG